jgi:hypothetical protein
MGNFNLKFFHSLISCWYLAANPVQGQAPAASNQIVFNERDSLGIVNLHASGIRIADKNVVAWFPKDSLSEKRMRELVDTFNLGIKAATEFINSPLPWQVHQFGSPYTFYFPPDSFVSHASLKGFVFIPFWRIKNGKAPWLHEVLHEMLNTKTGNWVHPNMSEEEADKLVPLWLTEGLADYISIKASALKRLAVFDVFSNSFGINPDSLFLKDLKSERGDYIISHIGKKGIMPELFSNERRLYAPTFYHGSCSFVKYIADHYGLTVLLSAISAFGKEQETIERLTGKSLEWLREAWLTNLKKSD